jgi:hypothetical protein
MVENASREFDDWRMALISHTDEMAVLRSPYARAAAVSTITGKEFPTMFGDAIGLQYDLSEMYTQKRVYFSRVLEAGYPESVPIDWLPPYVSGALVLGAVAGELPGIQHLKSIQVVDLDPLGFVPLDDAIKLANMYRLFGHDSKMTDPRTGEVRAFYAGSHECIVDPTVGFKNNYNNDNVIFSESIERAGRHYVLPSARSIRTVGKVVMYVQPPYIDMRNWHATSYPVQAIPMRRGKKKPVKFTIPGGFTYESTTLKARGYGALVAPPPEPKITARPVQPVIGLETSVLTTEQGELVGTTEPIQEETLPADSAL